ncbi:1337_t:CDS:2, partial [Gigaspora rosea]
SAIIVVGETREGKTTLLNYLTGKYLFSKERDDGFGGLEICCDDPLNNVDINNGSTSQTSLPYNEGEYWDCPGFGDTLSETTIDEQSKKKLLNLFQKLEKMRNGFLKILKERDGISSSQRNILNLLSSDRSQFAFFDAPHEEGPISDKDKSEILNCIEKMTYIKNLEPSISIGSYAKSFIKNLIEKFDKEIENFIPQKFDSAFLNYINDLIDNHDNTVKKLRERLNGLIEELKKISDAEDLQTFENNLDQILSIVKLLNKNDLECELSNKISQLKFIKQVKPETPNIQGIIIGTEDIAKKISSSISEINMYSLNSIFIDEDINAPGVILTLISPQLRVVGKKRKINLKGNPGPPHNAEKANDGSKEIINKQDVYDIINEKDARDRINQKTDNEVIDEINEKETSDNINNDANEVINKDANDEINKDANNEINKNMNEIEKNERDANNEINILKNECDNEKIGGKYVSDEINEKEASDEINKYANNELNKNINEVEANNITIKEKSDIEKFVNDEINEKEAIDGFNKDANNELIKNINEVEANNSILKEKSDIEIIGEQGVCDEINKNKTSEEIIDQIRKFKEENVEIIKEKTNDKIKTEETNDLINNVTRKNEISDEINIINKKKASSKMHGKDGSPGNSGYNGGQFYAKGGKWRDGGKGQDGGNGADGLDGSDCGKKFVEKRKKSGLISRKKVSGNLKETVGKGIKFLLTFNEKFQETYVAYDQGQEGGNGGRGGVGGDVGSHGSVWIELDVCSDLLGKPTIIKENNKKGVDGKRGSPGLEEKMDQIFSGFRGYREFNTKFTDESADVQELDTKFVDGVRVATNATISTATGLTAAIGRTITETTAKNAITFAIEELDKKIAEAIARNDKILEAITRKDKIWVEFAEFLENFDFDKKKQNVIKNSPLAGAFSNAFYVAIPLIISPVSAHFSSYWKKSHTN